MKHAGKLIIKAAKGVVYEVNDIRVDTQREKNILQLTVLDFRCRSERLKSTR